MDTPLRLSPSFRTAAAETYVPNCKTSAAKSQLGFACRRISVNCLDSLRRATNTIVPARITRLNAHPNRRQFTRLSTCF